MPCETTIAESRALGLSLGDRACLALGLALRAPVYLHGGQIVEEPEIGPPDPCYPLMVLRPGYTQKRRSG
jgi:hypothetical protein